MTNTATTHETSTCTHCRSQIRCWGGETWFDNWYDVRVAAICPRRAGEQPHEPERTPQTVRLEIALAKAHFYNSDTWEELLARDERLTALEAELATLDGGGCEHVGGGR